MDGVELRLWDLIRSLEEEFTRSEGALLVRLVHLRRYDEALLNLTWLVVEHDVRIAPEVMAQIRAIAEGLVDPDDFPYAFDTQVQRPEPGPAERVRPVLGAHAGHGMVRTERRIMVGWSLLPPG